MFVDAENNSLDASLYFTEDGQSYLMIVADGIKYYGLIMQQATDFLNTYRE